MAAYILKFYIVSIMNDYRNYQAQLNEDNSIFILNNQKLKRTQMLKNRMVKKKIVIQIIDISHYTATKIKNELVIDEITWKNF